ncbi:protein HP-25 homolog 2-like [Symphorus nematophorus]
MFTCVTPGVYEFSFLCTSFISAGSVDLWCNKQLVLRSFRVYQGGRHMSSGDTVLRLEAGDRVWLEAADGTNGLSTKSFFSGRLLYTVR